MSNYTTFTEIEKVCYEGRSKGYSRSEIVNILRDMGYHNASLRSVKDAINRANKKATVNKSDGFVERLNKMGVSPDNVTMAWLKGDDASIAVSLRDVQKEEDFETLADQVKEAFESNDIKKAEAFPGPSTSESDLLTKYVLADIHMGMYAYAKESGEDYSIQIAEDTLFESMVRIIESTPPSKRALILNVGDFFHANDSKNMTPKSGHILDVDGRFAEIAVAGIRALKRVCDLALEKHEFVEVANIPGNHDPDQAHWLAIALKEHYSNEPRLTVTLTESKWFMTTHGKNLIVAHHGDGANFNRLAQAIPAKYRKEWGECEWVFLDTGHVHHQREHEIGEILCRSYRSLAAKDAHAAGNAYTSKRSLTAHTYHTSRGEIMTNNVHMFQGKVA